ncbi:hypothetical protein MACK_002583 [Theileria orientalis]|uniref:Uncharacterized protein n=1 Tax=Theileria orientalis TaxID=68886 RepID=A0A976MDP0_THEOR|nr:hypothetical protein MACK_002583 [Theileria orientalis]
MEGSKRIEHKVNRGVISSCKQNLFLIRQQTQSLYVYLRLEITKMTRSSDSVLESSRSSSEKVTQVQRDSFDSKDDKDKDKSKYSSQVKDVSPSESERSHQDASREVL